MNTMQNNMKYPKNIYDHNFNLGYVSLMKMEYNLSL